MIQLYDNIEGEWKAGPSFTGVLSGSAISALTLGNDATTPSAFQLRVFYQATDFTLREFVYDEAAGWADGEPLMPLYPRARH